MHRLFSIDTIVICAKEKIRILRVRENIKLYIDVDEYDSARSGRVVSHSSENDDSDELVADEEFI